MPAASGESSRHTGVAHRLMGAVSFFKDNFTGFPKPSSAVFCTVFVLSGLSLKKPKSPTHAERRRDWEVQETFSEKFHTIQQVFV